MMGSILNGVDIARLASGLEDEDQRE